MSPGALVWITRAGSGADATASRLTAIGFRPMVAPLLEIHPVAAEIDLAGVGALAFTSTNGVKAFAAQSPARTLPVFAVGDATAKAAARAGFTDIRSADGEMVALARLIETARPEGVVLHPGPRQRAGDLVGALKRKGLRAEAATVYETHKSDTLPAAAAEALAARELGAVLLHSPRAAEALASVAAGRDFSEVEAFGLSPACLKPMASLGFARLTAAKHPRESDLLDALFATLGNSAHHR